MSQNRGRKIFKNGQNLSNFYLDKKGQNSKFSAPRFARGPNFFKSENLLKLRESPFPLYPPPRSSLTARSRPESYASAAAQTGQNPKFSILKKFFGNFTMTCMMTFLLRQSLLFLSQNRGRKFPKSWKNLEQFLFRQERPKFKNFRPSLRSGRIFKVRKSFKAKGKPIPPLSSPEIDLTVDLAQNLMPRRPPKIGQNQKFST